MRDLKISIESEYGRFAFDGLNYFKNSPFGWFLLVEKCLVVKGLFREVGLCHSSRDNGMVDVLVDRLAARLIVA